MSWIMGKQEVVRGSASYRLHVAGAWARWRACGIMSPSPGGFEPMCPADNDATPQLTATEARILGSLVEKEATTPEAYPLTANAVQLACNQKNNREPILELEAGEVGHALRELESRGLVQSVHGARAQRYEHRLSAAYSLTRQQQALVSVLLLRGPQTAA